MLERFRTLPPGRQILLVGLIVAVIAAILMAVWSWTAIAYRPLFKGLRTADAATIVAELDRRKIPYRLGDSGSAVLVPADKVDGTRLAVMSGDLPLKGTVGFELFNKSDMGLTDFAQRINYQRALQGELERTIMTLDRVETARVHLSLGENRLFRDDRVAPKASVTIRMENGMALGQAAAAGVQRLVAAAVPQLEPADVVILDEAGQVVVGEPSRPADAAAMAPMSEARHAVAEYYEARIREAIVPAYPGDAVAVQVRPNPPMDDDLAGWSPATRDFPLAVTLSPKDPLTANAEADLRALAGGAAGLDPARGDSLTFGAIAPGTPLDETPIAQPRRELETADAPAAPAAASGSPIPNLLIWALAFTAALAVAALWTRRPTGRLSDGQRAEMSRRLRAILDSQDGHAAGA